MPTIDNFWIFLLITNISLLFLCTSPIFHHHQHVRMYMYVLWNKLLYIHIYIYIDPTRFNAPRWKYFLSRASVVLKLIICKIYMLKKVRKFGCKRICCACCRMRRSILQNARASPFGRASYMASRPELAGLLRIFRQRSRILPRRVLICSSKLRTRESAFPSIRYMSHSNLSRRRGNGKRTPPSLSGSFHI